MDVGAFAAALLRALADAGSFSQVRLRTEGPVAEGSARVEDDLFLRFYFNELTQTIAFALIRENDEKQRIWGIDRDNRRGWHEHPVDAPADHRPIEPVPVAQIVARLRDVIGGVAP